MSKTARGKEKQQLAIEKPKLDNARRLRGISFIDLEDGEYKKTISPRKKLELQMEAAMPCMLKTHQYRETCGGSDNRKSKHACIAQVHESTRKGLERTLLKNNAHRIAGRGFISLSHCNLVPRCIPMRHAMKIPDSKAAEDKEWDTFEKLPVWQVTKAKNKKDVIQKTQKEQRTVHYATLTDICHQNNAECSQVTL